MWFSLRRFLVRSDDIPTHDDIIEVEGPDDPSPESVYLEASRHFVDKQVSAYDVLDSKAHQFFLAGGVGFTVSFALVNLAERITLPREAVWALWVALGFYIAVVAMVMVAGAYKSIAYGPDPQDVERVSLTNLPGVGLQRWVADAYAESAIQNAATLTWKGRWVGAANVFLWLEGIALAAAAILTLVFGLQ